MPHWHDFNPWADTLIYLPSLEEAARICCVPPITKKKLESTITRWQQTSRTYKTPGKLDPYLLRDGPLSTGPRELHLGIRWGKRPEEYFSPFVQDSTLALELYLKYGGH